MTAPAPIYCVIADDEPRLRQVLVRLMTGDGFTCLEAADGIEALEKLATVPAALLLSDLRMPKMDGIELLRRVRTEYPDLAVILITAVADVELALSCLANGAMDYLTKPFHLEEVLARVAQAMEKRRLILQNREYQAGLERLVATQARRLEELFLGGVQAVVQALEVKDQYTRGHSIRVSQYSCLLAREIRLPETMVSQIELGGQVHDIGKIGVREAVLNKEGPLTDEEYQHIMTHPMLGWQILSPLLAEEPVALTIVRSHHERFDGRGMPDRLSGLDIPLEARIAGVADAFDAMTSGRAYRRGRFMSAEDAIAEIGRCSGTQFDPELATAFIRVIRREKLASHQDYL
ncbi:MAG: response regulator [Gemmatimonadota bacterium]|nr:response regulator [Gemmatimonadota bacterium]